jgi:hypothetical protein
VLSKIRPNLLAKIHWRCLVVAIRKQGDNNVARNETEASEVEDIAKAYRQIACLKGARRLQGAQGTGRDHGRGKILQ